VLLDFLIIRGWLICDCESYGDLRFSWFLGFLARYNVDPGIIRPSFCGLGSLQERSCFFGNRQHNRETSFNFFTIGTASKDTAEDEDVTTAS